jgi:hypothetical protein
VSRPHVRRTRRRVVPPALGLLLAASSAACTGGSEPSVEPTRDATTGQASGSASVPRPTSVPFRTEVTHVAGRLPLRDRRVVATRVGRTLTAYVDAAFLGGDYPRSDFTASFDAFTEGGARQARGDTALLTNQPLGATTRTVQATRRTAYLSVLAPGGTVAGATAAVDLVFRVDRGSQPGRRVHLKGRLLLTKDRSGAWAIFGYDLNRSSKPLRETS